MTCDWLYPGKRVGFEVSLAANGRFVAKTQWPATVEAVHHSYATLVYTDRDGKACRRAVPLTQLHEPPQS